MSKIYLKVLTINILQSIFMRSKEMLTQKLTESGLIIDIIVKQWGNELKKDSNLTEFLYLQ